MTAVVRNSSVVRCQSRVDASLESGPKGLGRVCACVCQMGWGGIGRKKKTSLSVQLSPESLAYPKKQTWGRALKTLIEESSLDSSFGWAGTADQSEGVARDQLFQLRQCLEPRILIAFSFPQHQRDPAGEGRIRWPEAASEAALLVFSARFCSGH